MISIKETLIIAKKELNANFGRSILTMLGIIIGISAIMIVMAIGGSAEDLITKEIEIFGSDMIAVNPGKEPTGPSDFSQALMKDSLTLEDFESLEKKQNAPYAEIVVPSMTGSVSLTYESNIVFTTFIGSNENIFEMFKINVKEGNPIFKEDVSSNNKVVVLGKNVAEDLFGFQDPLNKNIKIKGKIFKVVGVASSESAGFLGLDDIIIMPYTTAMRYVNGVRYFQEIDLKVPDPEKINATARDIEITLRNNHDLEGDEENDFFITTPDKMMGMVDSVFGAITAFLALVAAISLMVGGIGMMNIMLISVTKRTREIGVRKAIGATNKDIRNQFLVESSILTGLGGILGIIFGLIITFLITKGASIALGMEFLFVVSGTAILLGLGVSAFVGIVFGLYPAMKAAKKDPVDSLRYE